ncbi:alpha/beta hydrolase [Candidatus Poribacteria bacterium]|nr:alpha/beta hydrolase [Candidatus Poribacteria bacterium]
MRCPASLMCLLAAVVLSPSALSPVCAEPIVPTSCLMIARVARTGRTPLHTDFVEAQIIRDAPPPQEGDAIALADGESAVWERSELDADGNFSGSFRGGYAYVAVDVPDARVMILEASGTREVTVNGEPRVGDLYGTGIVRLPVRLRSGRNDLYFAAGRGRLRVRLVEPDAPSMIQAPDMTLPDLIAGEASDMWSAAVVVNASSAALTGARIAAQIGNSVVETDTPAIAPLSMRKVEFRIAAEPIADHTEVPLRLTLLSASRAALHEQTTTLRVRTSTQTRKVTFVSGIDGSVQYYAVNPSYGESGSRPALVLTLHGAGVEAIGQADAYSPKSWAHIVAPTNRRPYGFDWEDWGRIDAIEVLDLAQSSLRTDPSRTYLTGHSMGGHGTWQVGGTVPSRFAAIGPSAGWISFRTYSGRREPDSPSYFGDGLLTRAAASSDTLALVPNYEHYGVYVLHGDADDNVPVEQARQMREQLEPFHKDFQYFEQPGAGHWWDASDEPGADCVDWAPMFDFFARHAVPSDRATRRVRFITANPSASADSHWLRIEAQQRALVPSSADVTMDPHRRRFRGTTENVERLSLDASVLTDGEIVVELDGSHLTVPAPTNGRLVLARTPDGWTHAPAADSWSKGPVRGGLFKAAFTNRFVFVVGTRGSEAETTWARAKARYDSEQWWYRGNGSVEIIDDAAFSPSEYTDRSVILYGNADTNAAWSVLLPDCPVRVTRGSVAIGDRAVQGDDLACLFVYPRADSDTASVGVVSGTGIVGSRLTDRLPYFLSGVGYADVTVMGSETLTEPTAGVRVTGFFGNDWSVERGEFVWRDAAP